MPAQPGETARENLGNAIMLLDAGDLPACRARLVTALAQLDQSEHPVGWTSVRSEDRALLGEEPET
jgi:hypothetical protein